MNRANVNTLSGPATLDLTSALADPTRYGIYEAIIAAGGESLTVAEVAAKFNLHPNVARMHLQKLVDVGLVRSDTRKSKGGGRPARIYRVSEQVTELQFPPRDYRTLAQLALQAVSSPQGDPVDALERSGAEAGHEEGRKGLARDQLDPLQDDFGILLESLRHTCIDLGLYPQIERGADGTLRFEIRNCVYRELSSQFPGLVCRLHGAVLRGLLEEYFPLEALDAHPSIFAGDSACLFVVHLAPGALKS